MDEEQCEAIVGAVRKVANAITPVSAMAGEDETGGRIESLTEAVMGITAGLCRIADAIESLADAVRETVSAK